MDPPEQKRIAILPGDGIGPEVMQAAKDCLSVVNDSGTMRLILQELPWPSTDWHCQYGRMMPEDGLEQLNAFDAILLGALGDPGPLNNAQRYHLPDHISLEPLLNIRKGFDLFICERPARWLPGAPRYLADPRAEDVDMLVVRENSEGEYVNQGGRLRRGQADEVATQLEVFTWHGTERLLRHAFQRAEQRIVERRVQNRPRSFGNGCEAQVCLITKRNALPYAGGLYCDVFETIAAEYPHIALRHELVDAACMKFVQSPWQFDVVVASNLQGDILTDLAAVLCGGMGLAASCNINPLQPGVPALYEPTHGSAPDIAGQNRADPRAMLLSTAMMLDALACENTSNHVGESLRRAVAHDLASHPNQQRGTREIGAAVVSELRRILLHY